MAEFDPSNASVDQVLAKLEKADAEEQQRILNIERTGKKRVTILEPYGIDPSERVDADGRVLYPWEVDPADEVRPVQVEETKEQKDARIAQLEFDEKVAAAAPGGDEQGGVTAAGVGVTGAPATATTTATATGTGTGTL